MPARPPSLPTYWTRFVSQYGLSLAYWYQPKGLAVTPTAVHSRLAVLKEFELTRPWRDCQADFVTRLRQEHISDAEEAWSEGGAPLARMLKQVMTVLGLAWVDPKDRVEITPAGHAFLDSKGEASVLAKQALRYQFWNPSVSSKDHQAIRLHPVPFLARLLLAVGGYVTAAEYNLFVAKAKRIGAIDEVAEQIDLFRALGETEQRAIVDRCRLFSIAGLRRSSIYNTIALNRPYAYRMWALSGLIQTDHAAGLRLTPGTLRGAARAYLDDYAVHGSYIDFADEKEFLAWMGDQSLAASESCALDVYLSRGDLFAATEAKKRLGATPKQIREFKRMMIDERTLEDNIEANFASFGHQIDLNLELVGRQYATT